MTTQSNSRNKYPTIRLRSAIYAAIGEPYAAQANLALARYLWLLDATPNPITEHEIAHLRAMAASWTPRDPIEKHWEQFLDYVWSIRDRELPSSEIDHNKLTQKLKSLSLLESFKVLEMLKTQ